MKLILIDGGPASGKNTLGELLVAKLAELDGKAVLVDLDFYVEELNPKWVWENDAQKGKDLEEARINFTKAIDKHLQEGGDVVAIGDRFMTSDDVRHLTSKINVSCPVYLYHLSVPFDVRKQRLYARGPHTLIDLEQDQKDRDAIKQWPGYVYENINTPEQDASNLFLLITQGKELI